jgi:hypothetical protein
VKYIKEVKNDLEAEMGTERLGYFVFLLLMVIIWFVLELA